jgi:GTPase SAR1 family protein
MQIYLVGTKCDEGENNYVVDKESIKDICIKYNMKYYETSSKKNININELFEDIIENLYKKSLRNTESLNNLIIQDQNNKYTSENPCLKCILL